MKYSYIVDMNERGQYSAHIEDSNDGIVWEVSNLNTDIDDDGNEVETYGELWLVEAGYMRNVEDMAGLSKYLIDMKVLPEDSSLIFMG